MCKAYENSQNKAKAEGRLEGRAEGRLEGRAEGRLEGRAEGRLEGRLEGRAEGRTEEKQAVAHTLREMGLNDETIAKAVNVSVALVRQWLDVAAAQ